MKSLLIFFSVLTLLLPIAAAETQIFSDKVITDQDKLIDGNIFRFTYDEASNRIFAQTPTQSLIIENGKCNSNKAYKVCISGAAYFDRNITTYLTYYKLDATVYKLSGSLSTVSTATPPSILPGESAKVVVTITNPTDVDVINIQYNENLTGFAITYVDGCTLKDGKLTWSGSIKSKTHTVCTATIIAQQEGTYNFAGSLSYFNGFETEKKATDSLTIKVLPKQLGITQSIDADAEAYVPFDINTTLQNINPTESMDVSIRIELPLNFELLNKVSGFSKNINILESDFKLAPGSKFRYSLHLKANAESKIPIKHIFNYKIKGLSDTIENDTFIKAPEPKPLIELSTDTPNIIPGQQFTIFVKIRNPSKVFDITDVRTRLNAPYSKEIRQNADRIARGESYPIITSTLVIPKDAEAELEPGNGTIMLNFSVEYSVAETAKKLSKTLELKVKSLNSTVKSETIKDTAQIPQEASKTAVAAPESNLSSKTEIVQTKIEKPISEFFNKENLIIIASVFALLLAVPYMIIKIRKRKKENGQLRENYLKDARDEQNKPKTF